MRKIFNLPGSAALAFITGTISGYPVGAKCIVDLYETGQCTKTDAERMIAFCNNSGPLFVLGSVGGMLGNANFGILLYASHIISSVIVGVLFRFYKKKVESNLYLTSSNRDSTETINSIVSLISTSVQTMLNICAIIILFSIFTKFLPKIPKFDILNSFITGLFEISNGIFEFSKIANITTRAKLSLISFILSFSGISVLIQVSSLISKVKISIYPYVIGKLMQGIISFFITYIFYTIINSFFSYFFEMSKQCLILSRPIQIIPKVFQIESLGLILIISLTFFSKNIKFRK
jgi:sporulation integral membrane protein YlbJ